MTRRRFQLAATDRRYVAAGALLGTIGALLGLPLLFLLDDREPRVFTTVYGFATAWSVAFAAMTLLYLHLVRTAHEHAVDADEDGLRPVSGPKGAMLVPWSAIARARDRHQLGRLDLLDGSGNRLLSLHHRLEGFEELRSMVLQRVSFTPSRVYSRNATLHLASLVLIGGPVGGGLYLAATQYLLFGLILAAFSAAVFGGMYLATPFRIEIRDDVLVVSWPGRRRTFGRPDVKSLEWSLVKRVWSVGIGVGRLGEHISLAQFGDSSLELWQALDAWRKRGE